MSEIAATRRGLLLGLGAVLILPGPAIVPASSLMPVKALPPSGWWVIVERLNASGLVLDGYCESVMGHIGGDERKPGRPLSVLIPPNRESPWGGTRLTLERGDYLPRNIRPRGTGYELIPGRTPNSLVGFSGVPLPPRYPGDGWASASL